MNATLPTGRAGRFLALGITLVVLSVAWLAVAAPLLDWHADRSEQLEQRRVLARRMEVLAQAVPGLQQTAARVSARGPSGAVGAGILSGSNDAIAAAALQQLVQDMASRAGASLSSAETLPATQSGGYRRIALHVALSAPWSVLIRLLAAIDQGAPTMIIDDLQLHGTHNVVQPPNPPLDAQFTVFAFRAGQQQPEIRAAVQ